MNPLHTERGTIAGGISVLMIFLTLCTAIYSLLSLLTAQNELSLNLKNRDAAIDYYAADKLAATALSELASAKVRGGTIASESVTFPVSYDPATETASFIVPIDTYRNLDVSIAFNGSGGYFVINRYCVTNSLDWQEQASGNITVITEFE